MRLITVCPVDWLIWLYFTPSGALEVYFYDLNVYFLTSTLPEILNLQFKDFFLLILREFASTWSARKFIKPQRFKFKV